MTARACLIVLNIPLHRHDASYWADGLWHKDLTAHCAAIGDLTIACPVLDAPPRADFVRLSDPAIVPLPPMGRLTLLRVPLIAARLWRAIGSAEVVHTGIVGWPFPLGWIAIALARLRRRPVVVVVESATWRIVPGTAASRSRRWRAALCEWLNRRLVASCDVRFFTTKAYRDALGVIDPPDPVMPTIWVDAEQLIEPSDLASLAPARRGRLLFAGRLTRAKGVLVLLDAIERSGIAVDFAGDGELADDVRSARCRLPHLVRLVEPVAYGAPFAALLDGYAALVLPTLSDDQPRVIFDAFARGLAVLASDTAANREAIDPGVTGLLFATDNSDALARLLVTAHAAPGRLAAMGAAARTAMAGRTHAAMHATRARLIEQTLAGRPSAAAWAWPLAR